MQALHKLTGTSQSEGESPRVLMLMDMLLLHGLLKLSHPIRLVRMTESHRLTCGCLQSHIIHHGMHLKWLRYTPSRGARAHQACAS